MCLAVARFLGLQLPYAPVLITGLAVLAYNCLFLLIGRGLEKSEKARVRDYEYFAYAQIFLDLAALWCVITLTGGLASPLLIFVIFHVILSGILLSKFSCYACAIVSAVVAGGMLLLHQNGVLRPGLADLAVSPLFAGDRVGGSLILAACFAACLVITAYLTTSIRDSLRFKGRELMRVSRELEISITKLTSLYEMVKDMDAHRKLDDLLNAAVSSASRIMGVKAGSIKLLDPDRRSLRFRAACGLSEDYLTKGAIDVEESEINRLVLEGSLYAMAEIGEDDRYQYPEDIRREGIASMLCLPLKVEDRVLGVLCVYGRQENRFTRDDVDFFSLMSDLTALSIERLNRDASRTWFLGKAAHQLRAPMNAVQSMLSVLAGGYQGEMTAEQAETVDRCRKRLGMLQETISDLLLLASERRELGSPVLIPTNPVLIMKRILPPFEAQAREKGLELTCEADSGTPPVLARERMLDDMFSNLISNAVKYTDPGGKVELVLKGLPGNLVVFEVGDTGIGMDDQDRAQLFREFFRGRKAREMTDTGTGLGMVIVKETVDLLGGEIFVDSAPGRGTRVVCQLPAIV